MGQVHRRLTRSNPQAFLPVLLTQRDNHPATAQRFVGGGMSERVRNLVHRHTRSPDEEFCIP